eukprot:2812832-Amphidinium_carterae.1
MSYAGRFDRIVYSSPPLAAWQTESGHHTSYTCMIPQSAKLNMSLHSRLGLDELLNIVLPCAAFCGRIREPQNLRFDGERWPSCEGAEPT